MKASPAKPARLGSRKDSNAGFGACPASACLKLGSPCDISSVLLYLPIPVFESDLQNKRETLFSDTAGRSPPTFPRLLFYATPYSPAVLRCGPYIVLLLRHSMWLLPYWIVYNVLPGLHPAFR